MSLILRLAVGALALAAVFLLPVVLAAMGYFDPPQDRAAYEERLALARGYLASKGDHFFSSNPKLRRAIATTIEKFEKSNPEAMQSHRDEVAAIFDTWIEEVEAFSTSATADWYAARFTAEDLRAIFDPPVWWDPTRLRRFVVFSVYGRELEAIKKRAHIFMYCRMTQHVMPTFAEMGVAPRTAGEELTSVCQEAAKQGFLDPFKRFH